VDGAHRVEYPFSANIRDVGGPRTTAAIPKARPAIATATFLDQVPLYTEFEIGKLRGLYGERSLYIPFY